MWTIGTRDRLDGVRQVVLVATVPFGVLSFVVMLFAWPRGVGHGQKLSPWDAIRKVDLVGNVLILCATTLMVFALQEAGTFTFSWNSPVIVMSLSLASLCWVGFMTWEIFLGVKRHTRVEPLLPLRLLAHRVYLGALVCTLLTGFTYLSLLIIIPERFQIVNGENALWSGIHLLPMLGSTAFGSFLAGALSSKRNNTSITLIASSCLQLIGAQYGYQVILGLGIGLSLGAATILTSVQANPKDLAVAQGAVAQARVFGGAVGIAVCSIVFNTKVASMADFMDASDLEALHRSPTITSYLPAEHRQRVRAIYASAFTADIIVMIGICAAAVLCSLVTYERDPPPMPNSKKKKASSSTTTITTTASSHQTSSKDVVMGSGGQSETELDELVHVRARG
ncbi:putative drug resistance transporter protein [Eutypa lata UCREL1]|uniref:Putative drug resistance transporter protein n=1 Tax=Eutypa lata (strain UCR-EL1) TaxID=1287681 RepID=M7SQV2_EUTLA|nr:putative drug resistance transporter protein [Eutypa lata UCREL1]